jgi:3-oxoacyl-[acyl-carrier protein] reductase
VGDGRLAGRAALITGASRGFGRAIALAFAPGGIETDMSRDVMTPEYRARRLAELPLRRFGSVDDVAYSAVVLASDEAGYLTGQILHPSGGWVTG